MKNNIGVLLIGYLLNAQICLSAKMNASCDNSSEKDSIVLMNTLFGNCFKESLYRIVIISNQSSFECSLWQPRTSRPYYLFNFAKSMNGSTYTFQEKHMFLSKNATKYSSTKYLILEDIEFMNLQSLLKNLKDSHIWNSQSRHVIKMTNIHNSCQLAVRLLAMVWSFNAINVNFMCHHATYGNVMYTCNPYSSFAPEPWIKVQTFMPQNGYPLTIFMNDGKKDICHNVFWNKLQNLSNYPVKVANITYTRHVDNTDDEINKKPGNEAMDAIYQINDIIWKKMETKIIPEKFSFRNIGTIDGHWGEATGVTYSVLLGEYECLISADYERGLWRNEVNLFTEDGVCFVMRKELASILEQLAEAFPLYSWLSFLLLFVSTTGLLTYLLQINYQDVAVDVLRVTVGAAMIHPVKTNSSKIVVVYVLFIFMIFNTYLQSKLEMLLTVEPSHGTLENLSDLIENDYKVYATPYYWQYYSADDYYRKNILIIESLKECLNLTISNSKIACINNCFDVKMEIQKRSDLILRREKILDKFNVQLFRDDSVIKDQFQKIYWTLYESGIPYFWLGNIDSIYRRRQHSHFEEIGMYQLRFAFNLLRTFQAVASVLFLFEIFSSTRFYQRLDFKRLFDKKYWFDK